ncbi:MAG: hypothetical protein H7Y13_00040 [Sphingobacteriaceae bacterium]|nr:hypothetical protein [Sphingobacteriaceae bacterium]
MYSLSENAKIEPLEMEKLYQDGYMTINIEGNDSLLYYKIVGYPKFSKIIRNGHDRIYETVFERKSNRPVTSIVADLLEAKILLDEDIKFIGAVSYHRLAKQGVRNLAILLSGEIHVKINVEKTLEYMGPGVFENVGLFPSYEEALTWFETLDN